MLNRASAIPLYLQVANHLVERIESGELAAGAQLPTEQELMATYGVSRVTVRQAAAILKQQGRLIVSRGKGKFITGRTLTHDLGALRGFYDSLRSQGIEPETRLLEYLPDAGTSDPENPAIERLPVRLSRLYFLNNRAFALVVSYLPQAAAHVSVKEAQRLTTYQILNQVLGVDIDRADVTIRCQRAQGMVAQTLGLKQSESALVMERRSFLGNGEICEAARIYIVPERYEFRLTVPGALEIAQSVYPIRAISESTEFDPA